MNVIAVFLGINEKSLTSGDHKNKEENCSSQEVRTLFFSAETENISQSTGADGVIMLGPFIYNVQ